MQLSEHFTLEEFTASNTAARLGIDNSLPAELIPRAKSVASALEFLRETVLGGNAIFITSGYRGKPLNAKVPGSSDTSAHTLSWAADFKCPGFGPPVAVCRAIAASSMKFDQLILEYSTWTHISVDPRMRRQVLTKRDGHGYETGLVV